MTEIEVPFIGVDQFCPDCQRLLLHVHPNGSFDLAGKAQAHANVAINVEDDEFEGVLVEATCLLRRCRFRRWIRRLS